MTFVLTERQALERLIRNDRRNIDALASAPHRRADVIADCAAHMLSARSVCRELERQAERNLRDALSGWR